MWQPIGAGAFAVITASGCGTAYNSTRPHTATAANASIVAEQVIAVDGPRKVPESPDVPVENVYVHAKYRAASDIALGVPTLSLSTSAPSSGGTPATIIMLNRSLVRPGDNSSSGRVLWAFPRAMTESQGLLHAPTSLDVPLTHLDGRPPECLRLPIVDGRGGAEWERNPSLSFGFGLDALALFRRIYGVAGASMFALRFGPWLGPVRVRGELAVGGAFAEARNPNLFAYAYGGGLRADTLLFSTGRFGLGAAAGYDLTGISFAPDVKWGSQQGAGFQGLIHGPRAGLTFDLLAQPAIGPAFRRRRDSESGSIEIYGASEWGKNGSATPALWFMVNLDAGI